MKEQNNKKEENCNNIEYPISISKYLAVCGVASRRKSTEIIRNGKVTVNSEIVVEPGLKLNRHDKVFYEQKQITTKEKVYVMLNKPTGFVCTSDDPYVKQKAIDLVDIEGVRLFTVGRLDKDSEGLILLTNDGDFANQIMHPKFEIKKRYIVTISSALSNHEIKKLCVGIDDEGDFLKAISITRKDGLDYEFIMGEGKKREIRRLVKSITKRIIRLQRIAIGGLCLNNLKRGSWQQLNTSEKDDCLKSIK